MNDRQNPNQWNNQWNNGPQPPQYQRQPQQPPQQLGSQPGQKPGYQQQAHQQPGYQQAGPTAALQQQPTQPAQPSEPKKSKGPLFKVLALLVILALGAAGGLWAYKNTSLGDRVDQAVAKTKAEMSYIAADDPGPEAFMGSVSRDEASIAEASFTSSSERGGVPGGTDNIYGGSGSLTICDKAELWSNLSDNDELNSAFAKGVGIEADDVERYLNTLLPAVLMQDTWVTNHGFSDGEPTPFQAVLQRGTGVLVDINGVPRVRCACGNPLTEAWDGYTAPQPRDLWADYDPNAVIAIYEDRDENLGGLQFSDLSNEDETFNQAFGQSQLNVSQEVADAVTSDTPVTVPNDMNVAPDTELMKKIGMQPATAESGKQRPTGGDRWSGFANGFAGGEASSNGNDAAAPSPSPSDAEEDRDSGRSDEAGDFDMAGFKEKLKSAELGETRFLAAGSMANGRLEDDSRPYAVRYAVGAYTPGPEGTFLGMDGVEPIVGDLTGDGTPEAIVRIFNYPGGTHDWEDFAIYDEDANLLAYIQLSDAPEEMSPGGSIAEAPFRSIEINDGIVTVEYGILDDGQPYAAGVSRWARADLKWDGRNGFEVVGQPEIL